jgi:16S rRNA processing protein RimM
VGRAHGLDGSFYVRGADVELLRQGAPLTVAGRSTVVVRRAGTDERPLVRLSGVEDEDADEPAAEGEWEAADLIGCEVPGLGDVRRVIAAPSCDLLEVGDEELLVPLVSDAVRRVDLDARVIEVDLRFLGLDEPGSGRTPR